MGTPSSYATLGVVLSFVGVLLPWLAAGRVLAVASIAVVAVAIGVFFGVVMVGIVSDTNEFVGDGSLGVGVVPRPVGPLVALAGSSVATAKRRR